MQGFLIVCFLSMVYGDLMGKDQNQENYDEQEAQKRFEAALRSGLSTSPKPLKDKPKVKKAAKKKAKKKPGN
jgi:hypothetical protein